MSDAHDHDDAARRHARAAGQQQMAAQQQARRQRVVERVGKDRLPAPPAGPQADRRLDEAMHKISNAASTAHAVWLPALQAQLRMGNLAGFENLYTQTKRDIASVELALNILERAMLYDAGPSEHSDVEATLAVQHQTMLAQLMPVYNELKALRKEADAAVARAAKGGPAAAPLMLATSASELDFGMVAIGEVSRPVTVTFANTSARMLSIDAVDVYATGGPADAVPFAIGVANIHKLHLMPGEEMPLTLYYRPTTVAVPHALLKVDASDGTQHVTQRVMLRGSATPQLRVGAAHSVTQLAPSGSSGSSGSPMEAATSAPAAAGQPVSAAAAAVSDRANYVQLAMTGLPALQLGESIARLNAAIDDLAAAVHQSDGHRNEAERATLQVAWDVAMHTVSRLESAHRPAFAASIRRHMAAVTGELQHLAEQPKVTVNPAALTQKAQASLTALQGTLALVVQLQASFPQLVGTGLATEIAKTTGWIAQLQEPAALASAASLAMAIEEQSTTVTEAAVEMTAVLARPVSTMTPAVLAAYVNVLAHASERRARVAPLLVRARVAAKRQLVDRSREALDQAEDATNELGAMDAASATAHTKTQGRLTQRRIAIEQRIKDGGQVRKGEIDTLENETREESLMTRTQAIAQRGAALAAALESLSGGVVGKLANQGRAYLPMLISNLHGIGKVMAAMRQHYAAMRDGNLQGDHRIHRRAAIVDFEQRLTTYFYGYNDKTGPLYGLLTQANQEIDDAKVRALLINFALMIGITLATAGTVGLAVRGTGVLVAGSIESGALTAAQAAWLVNAVGLSTSVLVGTAGQKVMGDEGSVASIVIVNALTPWAMGKFAALLPEMAAAAKVSSDLSNRWIKVERLAASALKLGGELTGATGSMLVGAGVNYVVRRGMGEKVGDPSQVTAEEWLMQGAALALGHVLMTRVGAMRNAIAALEGDRVQAIRNHAAAAELRAQTEALQHAAELLSSGDASPAKIQTAVKAYRHLQAAEAKFLDALAANKAQAAPSQSVGRAPATTAAEPVRAAGPESSAWSSDAKESAPLVKPAEPQRLETVIGHSVTAIGRDSVAIAPQSLTELQAGWQSHRRVWCMARAQHYNWCCGVYHHGNAAAKFLQRRGAAAASGARSRRQLAGLVRR